MASCLLWSDVVICCTPVLKRQNLLSWVQKFSREPALPSFILLHTATAITILSDTFIIDCREERRLKFVPLSGKTDESEGLNAHIQTGRDLV